MLKNYIPWASSTLLVGLMMCCCFWLFDNSSLESVAAKKFTRIFACTQLQIFATELNHLFCVDCTIHNTIIIDIAAKVEARSRKQALHWLLLSENHHLVIGGVGAEDCRRLEVSHYLIFVVRSRETRARFDYYLAFLHQSENNFRGIIARVQCVIWLLSKYKWKCVYLWCWEPKKIG